MIKITHKGNFDNLETFLSKSKTKNWKAILERFANEGVTALRSATPKDSGDTANAWGYDIVMKGRNSFSIYWTNSNLDSQGVPVVILLQYGHGTRAGTFVEGRDFINPAIRPVFDKISENLSKEVSNP